MNLLHSSISSFEPKAELSPQAEGPTLVAFPVPTPAFFVAAATFLVMGALFGYIGGWSHGAPPSMVHMSIPQRACFYNSTNLPRDADVVFFGDSLMELGIVPDLLASTLKIAPQSVKNMAVSSSGIWQTEWLVERCEPPRTDGPKIAVIGLNRNWFNANWESFTPFARSKIGEDRQASRDISKLQRFWDQLGYFQPMRRPTKLWLSHFYYDWFAYRFSNLVRAPRGASSKLWEIGHEMQKRAVARIDAQARLSIPSGEFAEHSVSALRLIINQLKHRSYRVVLFMPPLRHEVLELIERAPDALKRERRIRSLLAAPPHLGADYLVEFRDSQVLGGDDDLIFIDYAHLTREGAERQTRKLADVIISLGLLDKKPRSPEATMTGGTVSTR